MKALTDAVGLWRFGLCLRVVDILNSQVELIFVALPIATVFSASVRQDTQQSDVVLVIPGDDTVIEEVGGHQSVLAVVELNKGHLGIGIYEGLLIDTADTLERAYIISVLGA